MFCQCCCPGSRKHALSIGHLRQVNLPQMTFEGTTGAVDQALEELGVEYLDLMLLHMPGHGFAVFAGF